MSPVSPADRALVGDVARVVVAHSEVGIFAVVKQYLGTDILTFLSFVGLISANIGLVNLLPLPALDGGRIIFHLIDGIAGRKVIKKETEDAITGITLMLLLGLMLLISVKDVINLF